ncbi:hypothetical protein ADUPG1_002622, partial [Aduncisulcus paluster]
RRKVVSARTNKPVNLKSFSFIHAQLAKNYLHHLKLMHSGIIDQSKPRMAVVDRIGLKKEQILIEFAELSNLLTLMVQSGGGIDLIDRAVSMCKGITKLERAISKDMKQSIRYFQTIIRLN